MEQIRCANPHQSSDSEHPLRNHATPAVLCDICGNPAAVEDVQGIRLCEPHAVEAAGLDAISDQIRWDLTPAGELAVNPAGRPTCLRPRHRPTDPLTTP